MSVLVCPCSIRTSVVIVKTIVDIIKISVPVLLIIVGMIDLFKAITSKDEAEMKKVTKSFLTRIIAATVVFFVIVIVNFIITVIGDEKTNESWLSCWEEPGEISECKSSGTTIIEKPNPIVDDPIVDDPIVNDPIVNDPSNPSSHNSDKKTCSLNYTVTPISCFLADPLSSPIDLEEYLTGVLYGEEDPGINGNYEYMKAFAIVARTYTLHRASTKDHKNYFIKSCSSDQNWCDCEKGCYRYQTQPMFDACIVNSLKRAKNGIPYYTAAKCANRVTTAPGKGTNLNTFFTVNNPNWPSSEAKTATSTGSTTRWKGPVNKEYYEKLKKVVYDTKGLVIKKADGTLLDIGYTACSDLTKGNHLCPSGAKTLASQGYSYEEIIKEFTTDNKNITIECYAK